MHLLYIHRFVTSISSSSSFLPLGKNEGIVICDIKDAHAHTNTDAVRKKANLLSKMANKQSSVYRGRNYMH